MRKRLAFIAGAHQKKKKNEEEDSFNEKQIQALRTIYKAWRRPSTR